MSYRSNVHLRGSWLFKGLAACLAALLVSTLATVSSAAAQEGSPAVTFDGTYVERISYQGHAMTVEEVDHLITAASREDHIPDEVLLVDGKEVDLATLMDIRTMAEEDGLALKESIWLHLRRQSFSEINERLELLYPEDYAGGKIINSGRTGWIAFKGEVPVAAYEVAEDLPPGYDIFSNRGFSESELRAVLGEVYGAAYGHPGVADAAGDYDVETGAVTVTVWPAAGVAADDVLQQLGAAVSTVRSGSHWWRCH